MANLAIIASHYHPENTAASFRIGGLAQELQKRHSVTVYTLSEKGQQTVGAERLSDNLKVVRLPQSRYSGRNYLIRSLFEFYYAIKIFRSFSKVSEGIDRVVISIPYLSLLLLAPFFIKLDNVVLDCRDMVWKYLEAHKGLTGLFGKVVSLYVELLLPYFKCIVVTNDAEREALLKRIGVQKVHTVGNGISADKFEMLGELRIRNDRDRVPFRILCCGNVGRALHLQTALQAVKGLKDIEFHILGSGNLLPELIRVYGSEPNIYFHGKKSWKELLPFYSSCNLLYLQVHPSFSLSRPLRLIEYLATGLPILFAGLAHSHHEFWALNEIHHCEPLDVVEHRAMFVRISQKMAGVSLSQEHREFVKERFIREEKSAELAKIIETDLASEDILDRLESVQSGFSVDQPV